MPCLKEQCHSEKHEYKNRWQIEESKCLDVAAHSPGSLDNNQWYHVW